MHIDAECCRNKLILQKEGSWLIENKAGGRYNQAILNDLIKESIDDFYLKGFGVNRQVCI